MFVHTLRNSCRRSFTVFSCIESYTYMWFLRLKQSQTSLKLPFSQVLCENFVLMLVKCMYRYSSICQIHQGWSISVGKECENNKEYESENSAASLLWKHNLHQPWQILVTLALWKSVFLGCKWTNEKKNANY